MRRIVFTIFSICLLNMAFAQDDTTAVQRPPLRTPPSAKGGDHFMIQLGYLNWIDKPDSIRTSGLPRTFNMYFMFSFPFKTNPKWSVALGPGIATDNMYFDAHYVGIKDNTSSIRFQDLSDTNHFKKYKLTTTFLEAPVELRFSSKPDEDRKSFKVAIGAKVGTMLSAMVKGKDLVDKNDKGILNYTQKEKSKRFFNNNRLSLTARMGMGHFTAFASYSITPLFKEGQGPQVRPMTIGLTLSGL